MLRVPNCSGDIALGHDHLYAGLGRLIPLDWQEGVFLPSPAGHFFFEHVRRYCLQTLPRDARILEIGTGTGFIAIALALSGFRNILATDVEASHVNYARRLWEQCRPPEEWANLEFMVSDLYQEIGEDDFDLVIFNAPGWRTPSSRYQGLFRRISASSYLSMFEGDRIASDCIVETEGRLADGGRLFIGLNSISGIPKILDDYRSRRKTNCLPMRATSIDQRAFPLLLYNEMWQSCEEQLVDQLELWMDEGASYHFRDESGKIYWVYEIVEFVK